ncbi:MAG: hypothetical protein JF603_06795 [Acidobacteria bacterium]|nr:hypothetical protein [Acidobacteriota bacterium]
MLAGAERRQPLWLPGDVALLSSLNLVAAALLVAAAWATTATDDLSLRVAWVNLGVVGLLVAGAGNVLWLLAGRRAIGERRAELLVAPSEVGADDDATAPTRALATMAAPPDRLVSVARATLFHRDDCPLVQGKPVTAGIRSRHERAGRRPCGVCLP